MNLPESTRPDNPVLDIRNVTVVTETGKRILRDVNLMIPEGEHTVILGPNGSGKSSLIKLITHQYRPYAPNGEPCTVQIFGMARWHVSELRSMLGIVSFDLQQTFLLHNAWVPGLEAVAAGFFASERVFSHHDLTEGMLERARAALGLMEVSHLAERPLQEMSTGEIRRIIIARALAPDPRALILDEPTTGLDLVARHRFLDTLRKVARSGKTIILVTHHVDEIFPEIRRTVLIHQGAIYRDGSKEEVLRSDHLSHIFEAPVHVEQLGDGYYTATTVLPDL